MVKKSHSRSISFNFLYYAGMLTILIMVTALGCSQLAHSMMSTEEGGVPHNFILGDLNGKYVKLSDYTGKKPVVVLFWKIMEDRAYLDDSLDQLLYLDKQYAENKDNLDVLALYVPGTDGNIPLKEIEKVRSLVQKQGIKVPVLIDRRLSVYKDYGVISLPSTVMLDEAGIVKYISPGYPMSVRPEFAGHLNDLIESGKQRLAVIHSEGNAAIHGKAHVQNSCTKKIC